MLKKIICGIIFVIGVLINCNAEITPLEVPEDFSNIGGTIWKCDTKDELAFLIEDFELNFII